MDERVEITIVGGGVVGCAVAHLLAQAGREVVLIERNPGLGRGENQSTRNSGVIHAGLYYDAATRPLKARLCVRGNALLHEFCARHDVPRLACGKLIVAQRPHELPMLETYLARAQANGVPCSLIGGEAARAMEPQVASVAALRLPSSGIIDAPALVHKLYALAANHGATFLTQTSLTAVRPRPEGLEVTVAYRDGARDSFLTGLLINCAGLHSDEVAAMADPASPYRIDPLRGEAAKFYRAKRPDLALRGMNVYPTPHQVTTAHGSYFTVGVHLTPTLEPGPGGKPQIGPLVTVGPLNQGAASKEDLSGDFHPMAEFHARVAGFFPGLRVDDLEPHQVGLQARLAGHQDWLVQFSPREPRCLNLLGIDSPGLTSCLALAEMVREMLEGAPPLP